MHLSRLKSTEDPRQLNSSAKVDRYEKKTHPSSLVCACLRREKQTDHGSIIRNNYEPVTNHRRGESINEPVVGRSAATLIMVVFLKC